MHILHALHSFPPESQGGIESYVQRLAEVQAADRLRVTILAGRHGATDDTVWTEDEVGGLRVLRLRPWLRDLEHAIVNPDADDLFVRLRDERVDLLHVHHWHNTSGDLVARAAESGIPSIVTMHDYFSVCPWFFRMWNDRICAPDVALETCVACTVARTGEAESGVRRVLEDRHDIFRSELSRAGVRFTLSADQAAYLRDVPTLQGLDFELAPPPEPELASPHGRRSNVGDAFRIVSWGGLVRGKGMHVLLEACEMLTHRVEVHHFGRVLEDDYVNTLREIVQRTRFVMHGGFDAATMEREFAQFDVAVFPSLFRETYGFVVDEAMQLGLPVVVSDRGAPTERLGSRGVTYPADDPEALAATLQRFLDEPETLAALRAGERIQGNTMAAHWNQVRAAYERVLATWSIAR